MKTQGMKHQVDALRMSYGKRNFAYLFEQGCGKTWTTLADAERCFAEDKIDGLLVVAPNGVHTNWIRREIPTHLECPSISVAWRGTGTKKEAREIETLYHRFEETEQPKLRIFSINIDAINTPKGFAACERFLQTFRVMMALDESTRIKNPASARTKKAIKLGRQATARRILDGTPITKGPPDLFAPFDFLKPGLLGTTSYRAFVSEYSVLEETDSYLLQAVGEKIAAKAGKDWSKMDENTRNRMLPQIIKTDLAGRKQWRNLDKLRELIKPVSFRVTKAECLDLPPKVRKVVNFELPPNLRKVYSQLEEDYFLKFGNMEEITFAAIAARSKMKQVTSGFVHIYGEPVLIDPNENPRMDAFKSVIENIDSQCIVWALFEEEINQICAALKEAGKTFVTYYGATSKEDREKAIDDFQAGRVDYFVGHAAAAGIGLTLTAAETAVYYSCGFDNGLRLQSEDRCHRIGTTKTILYIDLIAIDTIDEDIARNLQHKTEVANYVIDGISVQK